ncbi:hypothetical protein CWE08_06995 [Aliidiomarina iranensis]|uniref:diguanylate cyclase n=1 Tax=Aliidiomarina iranensis TaxID=1434071 RepID=A0A432VWK2_9GAMM|nr:GGDEF domain-containing protein [Aliidiomarina iranensis]RUO20841.1 hypothetical protein CWE08_06995 [Aliidiomarina iranensis]
MKNKLKKPSGLNASLALTHDPEQHQRSLLNALLIIIFVFSAAIGTINILNFGAVFTALFNYISMLAAALIWLFYKRTKNLSIASWLLCGAVLFNLFAFMYIAKGGAYSLIWITVLPPVTFFLLGKRSGSWLTGSVFCLLVAVLAWQMPNLPSTRFSMGALLNITEVLLALWLVFRHYEGSREAAFAALERLSVTDKLTGLHNRAKLDLTLEKYMGYVERFEKPFAVLLIDIDHFKRVNDKFGHLQGDLVLQKVAKILHSNIRKTDELGRWGGEEFLLLCPDTDLSAALHLAQQLREKIAKNASTVGTQVTVSIGVAEIRQHMATAEALGLADTALYRAKENGRNCVVHA